MTAELGFRQLTADASHFQVLATAKLPIFDFIAQFKYRQAVADTANVLVSLVKIRSITGVANGIAVETIIHTPVPPPSLTIANLNNNLASQGLPAAVLVAAPAVISTLPLQQQGVNVS